MAGLRQDELFELDFDPGKPEASAGDPGQIRGEAFQQFARDTTGLRAEDLAESVVVDGFAQIVAGGGPGKGGHGEDGGAKDGLGFAALGVRDAEMAGELQIDNGERGGHGVLV